LLLGQRKCTPTQSDVKGPKFVPQAPRTTILAPSSEMRDPNKKAIIFGKIVDRKCRPIPGARVDLWYAGGIADDGDAIYTAPPQRLWYRGWMSVGKDGAYRFEGTYPGVYRGRPIRHYHIKIEDGGKEFITQMYFKGDIPASFANYVKRYGTQPTVTRAPDGTRNILANIVVDM